MLAYESIQEDETLGKNLSLNFFFPTSFISSETLSLISDKDHAYPPLYSSFILFINPFNLCSGIDCLQPRLDSSVQVLSGSRFPCLNRSTKRNMAVLLRGTRAFDTNNQ